MRWYGLRVPIIIFALLAGLGIFFGGQWIYQRVSLSEPLDRVLKSNKYIKSFQVNSERNILEVTVSFNDDANLMEAYQEVERDLAKVLGNRTFRLVVRDNRDDVLQQVFYKSQFVIYQAIARGTFQDMADFIGREASAANAVAEVYVDNDYVYLRLKREGHILDQVIARDKK
ncbi:MAG: hypothetical protein C4589_10855 [Peptococcaceae bacterium]|nr:MAG: hypothetical protein C4589_10855 [Peptococcaceae bacterium]